jgi:superfamily II DNA or RNA helicase
MKLRPYQLEGVEHVRDLIRAQKRRVLMVAATGAGKTVVFAHVIASAVGRGKRALVVAHRREIISQTYRKLVDAGLAHEQVGVVLAGVGTGKAKRLWDESDVWKAHARRRPVAPVQLGSIDTIRARGYAAMSPPPDLIVIDEAHRAMSKSYQDLVAAYPGAVVLGFTATPERGDGEPLNQMFDELVVVASPAQLMATIDDETGRPYLVRPRVFTVPVGSLPDLSGVKLRGGDYDERQLAGACDTGVLVGDIVGHWQRRAEGMRTVAFAVSVEHSRHITRRFVEAGVAAEHLDGETPTVEREAILRRLASGETRVVSNCAVLTEGWDQPIVGCCILARPTRSPGLYLQCAGRVLRPHAEKPFVLILDHAGCCVDHGLPQDEREYSLEGRKRRKRVETAKVCPNPECLTVLPLGCRVCPECGLELPVRERPPPPTEGSGELVEADLGVDVRAVRAWDKLVAAWKDGNARKMAAGRHPAKPGWLYYAWREKMAGRPLPKGVRIPKLTDEEKAALERHDAKSAAPPDLRELIADAAEKKTETELEEVIW